MLRQLKLTNFRQHEDLTLNFDDGLVVLRGKNEAGKSTIILGVLYAWFGAKVLPLPLADTVTWGKAENTLAVENTILVEGVTYLFKRSSKGAECHYNGKIVTGQNEVSRFASEILGADYATVSKLMVANQNNLRGALEEGPTAVSKYIEDLSGMDLFDTILTRASEKLLTGNESGFVSNVETAKITLEQMVVEAPDFKTLDTRIETATRSEKTIVDRLGVIEPEHAKSKAELDTLRTQEAEHNHALNTVAGLKARVAGHAEHHTKVKAEAEPKVSDKEILALQAMIADSKKLETQINGYKAYQALDYPEVVWEGDVDSFNTEFTAKNFERLKHTAVLDQLSLEITRTRKEFEKPIAVDLVCSECGRAFDDADGKAQHIKLLEKAKVDAGVKLADLQVNFLKVQTAISDLNDELDALRDVDISAKRIHSFNNMYAEYISIDTNFYPNKPTWTADKIVSAASSDVQTKLDKLLADKNAEVKAQGQLEGLEARMKADALELVTAESHLDPVDATLLQATSEKVADLTQEINTLNFDLGNIKINLRNLQEEKRTAEAVYNSALASRERTETMLKTAEEQLVQVRFNNTLVKKIRSARPIVADKLWATVLMSVSTMFTQMRGTPSVVTKDAGGFAVNGESVSGLSGSTLDILGLALRSSLVKSFLPHTAFLVLDEPGAAMDEDRATNMLGFVAASGFKQTLLITHDGLSEHFASQVISI